MDATKDDSDIYNFEYHIRQMASWSKELDLQVYQSEVDHPMSNIYRKASVVKALIENALTTKKSFGI